MLFEKDANGFTKKTYTRALGFAGGIGGIISLAFVYAIWYTLGGGDDMIKSISVREFL